jgi:hypothetical protein
LIDLHGIGALVDLIPLGFGVAGLDNYYEVGVSGVLGLDYTFDNIPLNVSVDWAPTFVLLDSWDFTQVLTIDSEAVMVHLQLGTY